jgi:Protein of unknown function (DUF4245)
MVGWGSTSVSEQPSRYQRSTSGMVGALLVTVLVILAFVGFRAWTSTNVEARPQHVDYLAQIGFAQQAGADLVYPASLPGGWYVTRVDYSPGRRPELGLSMLTPGNEYAGLQESPLTVPELLTTYVDGDPTSGAPVTLDSGVVTRWETWTDSGGDTALTAQWHHQSLMVFGSASRSDLEALASTLTTKRLSPAQSPSIAASSRRRAPSSHSWQIVASFSPRSQRARLSSSVVPPASSARTTSISSARAAS